MGASIILTGSVEALLFDVNGTLIQRVVSDNLVVTSGLSLILTQLVGITTTPAKYIALGSSTTATSIGQTALVTENPGGVRKAAILTPTSTSMLFSATWANADNANSTINEVGIFTQTSGGVMLARVVLASPIPKDQSSQLTINWTTNAASS